MQCSRCGHEAVIYQPYSGLHLCRHHFVPDFEAKAKRAIRTHAWLQAGDHIAVALRGGDGSGALLYFLKKLTGERRDITFSAIAIDEGIANRTTDTAEAIAASLGVPCITASFADEYGATLADILQERGGNACTTCRVLKRTLLHRLALRHKISRIALGSSLDDEAESALADVLSGDIYRLLCRHAVPEGCVPFIRPFMYIPHEEILLYSDLNACGSDPVPCLYGKDPLHRDAGNLLSEFTGRHPSARYSVVRLTDRISAAGTAVAGKIPVCAMCGEPVSGICEGCRIVSGVTCHAR